MDKCNRDKIKAKTNTNKTTWCLVKKATLAWNQFGALTTDSTKNISRKINNENQ